MNMRALKISTSLLFLVVLVLVVTAVALDRMVMNTVHTDDARGDTKFYYGMWSVCADSHGRDDILRATHRSGSDTPLSTQLCASTDAWLDYLARRGVNVKPDAALRASQAFSVIAPLLTCAAAACGTLLAHGDALTFSLNVILTSCIICILVLYATWYRRNEGIGYMKSARLSTSTWLYVASLIVLLITTILMIWKDKMIAPKDDTGASAFNFVIPVV